MLKFSCQIVAEQCIFFLKNQSMTKSGFRMLNKNVNKFSRIFETFTFKKNFDWFLGTENTLCIRVTSGWLKGVACLRPPLQKRKSIWAQKIFRVVKKILMHKTCLIHYNSCFRTVFSNPHFQRSKSYKSYKNPKKI